MNSCFEFLNTRIDVLQIPEVLQRMERWINEKELANYICIANMNDVVYSSKNEEVRKAINAAALSVPDGISLVLLARLYGYPLKKRVYGPDLMLEFLKIAQDKGYSNFFYGSTPTTLNLLIKNLKDKFPRLNITGVYSPPYRELSDEEGIEIIKMINKNSPDILWVGLGCPKQQLWMYKHKDRLKVPVMVGVGAAFDFLAGTKSQAPYWIRENGFEWLYRLIKEPRRLWKRYLVGNAIFIGLIVEDFLKNIMKNGRLKGDVSR